MPLAVDPSLFKIWTPSIVSSVAPVSTVTKALPSFKAESTAIVCACTPDSTGFGPSNVARAAALEMLEKSTPLCHTFKGFAPPAPPAPASAPPAPAPPTSAPSAAAPSLAYTAATSGAKTNCPPTPRKSARHTTKTHHIFDITCPCAQPAVNTRLLHFN